MNTINLTDYGFSSQLLPENSSGIPARVTSVHKERFGLICEYGEIYGRLKTKEYYGGCELFPTVGDFVMIDYIDNGDSRIIATLSRRTYFSRKDPDPRRNEQAVAANFDYVFIMQSLNKDFNLKRLERYLTLGWQSGATPVIILTKADLVYDPGEQIEAVEQIAPGVAIHAVSVMTGYGLDALEPYLRPGKTIVFLGSSGIGKSSLVNTLSGEKIMEVNTIREDDSRGRHTTTHRQLLMLPSGAMVIDTPGMRELAMWDVSDGLSNAFADVEQFLGKCRFRDCSHQSEPGCAIKAAIRSGELSAARWKSYCALEKEARYADDRADFMRQKQQWSKNLRKGDKNKKKENWSVLWRKKSAANAFICRSWN